MSHLHYISDDVLRQMIERDRRELSGCLQNGLYKSTILLAGSVIEAVLVDYFLAFQAEYPYKMGSSATSAIPSHSGAYSECLAAG